MTVDVLDPPADRPLSEPRLAARRAHLLAELDRLPADRTRLPSVARRRPLVIAVAGLTLAGGIGTAVAVGFDLVAQQERLHRRDERRDPLAPKRLGPIVSVAGDERWGLLAWRSDRGLCLDFAIPGSSATSCGFPVVGAPPDRRNPDAPAPKRHLSALFTDLRPGVLAVGGVASPDVIRVVIELEDGTRVAPRLVDAPARLATRVRLFLAELPDVRGVNRPGTFETGIRAMLAYDKDGRVLDRVAR